MTFAADTDLLLAAILAPTLVVVTCSDLARRIIPNRVLGAATLAGAAVVILTEPASLPPRLLAALAAGALLQAPNLLQRDAFGMGDVKLAAALGLLLGPRIATALIIALFAGTLVGAAVALRRRATAPTKATIPFAPFLALGSAVAMLMAET